MTNTRLTVLDGSQKAPTYNANDGKKGRILLLTPNLKGVNDTKSVHRIQPPLGPMIAANVMRQQGHDVYFHDCALAAFDNRRVIDAKTILIGQEDEAIAKVITEYQPDVVGISALFSNLMDSAHNIAKISKQVYPTATVILGGNHISNAAKDYEYARTHADSGLPVRLYDMEDSSIDFAMHGEVDFEFPNLVTALLNKKDFSQIPGLVRRKENGSLEYVINHAPAGIEPLSSLPRPARDLVDMERYFDIGAFHSAKSRSKRVVNVMASRGCPEKCTFCTTPSSWGTKVRWREISDVVQEIKEAQENHKVGEIQFEDDTITANKPMVMKLCKELEQIGLPWCTPNGTKVNYHMGGQLDMYKAMHDSGCYQITLACESGVQRILDDVVGKNLNIDDINPSIENAKKAGMLVHTFWILGYPGETYEEMKRTIEFAKGTGADSYSFSILNPLPGTPIYRDVIKHNLWWPGRNLGDILYRNSLLKVDGFSGPEEFEAFVTQANYELNSMQQQQDPERFKLHYGENTNPKDMMKQT